MSNPRCIRRPPKTPKLPSGILRGELYLAYIHSQTNPQTCTKFGVNRSSCLTSSPDVWICDPLKPPGVLRGELHLVYVDSQTNPQIRTKFGANRSSRLTASTNIWICDPLTPPPPPMPMGYCGANGIRPVSISRLLNLWPPPPQWPLGYWGATWS